MARRPRPFDSDDVRDDVNAAAEALAACLPIPDGVPERDMVEIRLAILRVVNRNVEAFLQLARTLTPDETKLLATIGSLTDHAIKDRRFVETRQNWEESQALEWLRTQLRSPSEIQAVAIVELPDEMILKRAEEIRARAPVAGN